jgi:protease IV
MNPTDPNEPLPTTPVGPAAPAQPVAAAAAPPQAPMQQPGWGAPPWGPPPAWGGGWGGPPPPPPRRDRLAIAIVATIFGGLFLVFFGFLLLAYSVVRGESPRFAGGPRIGVIQVKGGIGMGEGRGADAEEILKQVRKFREDDGIKAIVVRIDSPGGSVGPSQEIHDEVAKLAKKKVVVCSLGNVAASGGYYVAVACPKIVSAPGTLTASIGVVSQFANVKGLAERFDIKMETVKSGKLKDLGNPFRDMTPEDRAYWQSLIDRVYQQFVDAVAAGRGLSAADVRKIADGRVVTGADAKELGLVDQLGNFYDAVELAKSQAKLTGEPTLVYPPDERRFLEQLMGGAAGAVADAISARIARDARAMQQPGLYFLAQ